MDCEDYKNKRVKLGYVADSPTSIQLVDSFGSQPLDLLPVIQSAETDTSIALLPELERIRYYPEEYTRTEGTKGCYYDICISDIAALIDLNSLRNVESVDPSTGETIMYNGATQMYEMYDLAGNLAAINTRIDNLTTRVENIENAISELGGDISGLTSRINQLFEITTSLQNQINALGNRISDIENAIYNWANDKNTKIPRGNINVTSGGYNSGNGIFSRTANQNNDLDFQ